MKFCTKCGQQLDDKVTVCVHCGYELDRDIPEEPKKMLKTDWCTWKFIVLSIVTVGIYYIIAMTKISKDVHTAAYGNDRKATMPYWLVCLFFSWLTAGLALLFWYPRISSRIADDLAWRGIENSFGAKDFWLWGFLGSIIVVGPFIYQHKLLKAVNKLCDAYNKELVAAEAANAAEA